MASLARTTQKQAEAGEALRLAAKSKNKGFLGMGKPNWEQAARHYDTAAKCYRIGACKREEIGAHVLAADAYEKMDSIHSAAKNLEQAALACSRLAGDDAAQWLESGAGDAASPSSASGGVSVGADAAACYERAGTMYRLNQQPDKSATQLCNAAKCVGDGDKQRAVVLLTKACNIFIDEERGKFANDTFKMAANYMIKIGAFDEAVALLGRQNRVLLDSGGDGDEGTFVKDVHKNKLSVLIVLFGRLLAFVLFRFLVLYVSSSAHAPLHFALRCAVQPHTIDVSKFFMYTQHRKSVALTLITLTNICLQRKSVTRTRLQRTASSSRAMTTSVRSATPCD
jgi:tetratricopeptide (TPR) repeat protein